MIVHVIALIHAKNCVWHRQHDIFSEINDWLKEAPFSNVLFPYGHCPKGEGCKGLAGWFGALFSMFARLTEGGGGLKLFGQCPYRTNTFQKRASLTEEEFKRSLICEEK